MAQVFSNRAIVETTRKFAAVACIVFCLSMATTNILGAFAAPENPGIRLADDALALLNENQSVVVTLSDLEAKQGFVQKISSYENINVIDELLSLPSVILENITAQQVLEIAKYENVLSIDPARLGESLNNSHLTQMFAGPNYDINGSPKLLVGTSKKISIIDSGVQIDSPVFSNETNSSSRVKSLGCFEAPDTLLPCNSDPAIAGNPICLTQDQMEEECFHGTTVADMAAGNRATFELLDGGHISVGGVAYRSEILSSRIAPNAEGLLRYEDVVAAFDRILHEVKNKTSNAADVVNFSAGFDVPLSECTRPSALNTAINELVKLGVPVVAASGNDSNRSKILYPACAPNVIAVGSSAIIEGNKEVIADFSNMSSDIDLVAPGANITSFLPNGEGAVVVSGTSYSSPLVAGAIAVLKELKPNITPTEILSLLKSTADSVVDEVDNKSYPRINLEKAVVAASSQEPITTTPENTQPQPTSSQPVNTQPTQPENTQPPTTKPQLDPTTSQPVSTTPNSVQVPPTQFVDHQEPQVGGEVLEREFENFGELPYTGSTSNHILFASIWLLAAGLMMMLFKTGITKNQLLYARVRK